MTQTLGAPAQVIDAGSETGVSRIMTSSASSSFSDSL